MKLKHTYKTNLIPYIFILPFIVFFVMFRAVPMILTFLTSITEQSNDSNIRIVLTFYSQVFSDPMFYKSIINTLIILLFYLIITVPLVIYISIHISKSKYRKIMIALMLIPTFVGMFAYAIIFRYMFTYNGVVNNFIHFIFSLRVDWFGEPIFAQLMIAITLSWTGLGYFVLIYTNGILGIPSYYYDAIKLETNSRIKIFLKIQLPMTLPIIKSIIFMCVIELFALVDLPMNLTAGTPQQSTITLSYYIYQQGLEYFDFAYAAAISMVITVLCIIIFMLFRTNKEEYYEMV